MNTSARNKNSIAEHTGSAEAFVVGAVTSAHDVVDQAANLGHQAIDSAVAAAEPAQAWVSEKADTLIAAQHNALDQTRKYIVENPLQSIAIALAAGLLIGRLTSR
jgi:ElaB/YqjD/DUF883 family membrane-anchored ribosome-binding protein